MKLLLWIFKLFVTFTHWNLGATLVSPVHNATTVSVFKLHFVTNLCSLLYAKHFFCSPWMTLYKSSVLLSEVYCTMKQLSFLFVKSTVKTLKSIHKNKEENQGKVTLQILFAYSWSARSILSSLGSLLYLCVYLNSTLSETNSSNSSFGSSISQTKREKRVTKSVI